MMVGGNAIASQDQSSSGPRARSTRSLNPPWFLELRAQSLDGALEPLTQGLIVALAEKILHTKSIESSIHLIRLHAELSSRRHVLVCPRCLLRDPLRTVCGPKIDMRAAPATPPDAPYMLPKPKAP